VLFAGDPPCCDRKREWRSVPGRTKQIPAVPFNIQEYRDLSIGFDAWCGEKLDARPDHPRVHRIEVIDAKEETDPAGKLVSNDCRLTLAIGAREQNASVTTGGTDDDPTLRAAVIRQRRNILYEIEPEDIHEEVDRWLVLAHNQGDEMEV
jgi:hypothetical protein